MKPNGYIHPLTVIADRYSGAYSGGYYTAWQMYASDIPEGPEGDNSECGVFWADYWAGRMHYDIGIGDTPDEAASDLKAKIDRRQS